ncbi:MAG: FAD-dependent monooxygenase, partial [Aestuariivirgaceae bacterium]
MGAEKEIADIAIVGGGLTGLTAALALGAPAVRTPFKVIVADPLEAIPLVPDPRALAITYSSRRMFEAMGLWDRIAVHAEPLREIVVTDSRPGITAHPVLLRLEEKAARNQPSCHFVESNILHSILADRLRLSSHVQLLGEGVSRMSVRNGLAELETSGGNMLRARLIVAADGKNSACRTASGIEALEIDYQQRGIVATIAHELPHGGEAHENFLPAGPFAVLPLSGKRSSIVWTEEEGLARRLMAGSEEDFTRALRARLGDHLGRISVAGARQAYSLSMMIAESFIGRRIALVGDAAHVIHPLAGLGFNLGMRDVAALAETLVHHLRLGLDIGGDGCLENYQLRRRMDTVMAAFATDLLNRLFSNEQPSLKLARDLGLRAVGLLKPAQAALMR